MSFVDDAQKEIDEYFKSEQFVKDRERDQRNAAIGSSAKYTEEQLEDMQKYGDKASYIFGGYEQERAAAWRALPFDQKLGYYTERLASLFGGGNPASPAGSDAGSDAGSPAGSDAGSDAGSAADAYYSPWSGAAQQFGMDRETAYAEHMANTAHQREVADLKAAGLNPVLGISGSGASGVSGSVASGASGASSAQKGINSDALVDVIGATAGLLVTVLSKNPSLGAAAGKAAQAGGNLLFGD